MSLEIQAGERIALMGPPKAEIEARVTAALAAIDMAGFEERMPHQLNIGQRKRVSLATVLSMDPEILVLDEPSAGLDPRAWCAISAPAPSSWIPGGLRLMP